MLHLLVVDDDKRIRDLLKKFLCEHKYLVSSAKDGYEALELIKLFQFDLAILDVMMPGISGNELLKSIRERYKMPVILLSALNDVEDRIVGLETGANDYLGKPFEPKELLLRINNIILQTNKKVEHKVKYLGNLKYDYPNNQIFKNGIKVSLTLIEEKLLKFLIDSIGGLVTREQISKLMGGVNERTVDVQIARLRHKIEDDPKKPEILLTIRGQGYKINDK